jgi:hypothetical protein
VKQCLPAMAARGTATPVGEWLACMASSLRCASLSTTPAPGPASKQVRLSSALPVGDSDTPKAEPGRGTSGGAVVRT